MGGEEREGSGAEGRSGKGSIEPITSLAHLKGNAAKEEILVDVAEEEALAKELLERRKKQEFIGKVEVRETFSFVLQRLPLGLAICTVRASAESAHGSYDHEDLSDTGDEHLLCVPSVAQSSASDNMERTRVKYNQVSASCELA